MRVGNTGFVRLIDHMGSDLTVVNAARISLNKRKEAMDEKDEGLIHYLAEHEHTAPFRHAQATFHIKAPIFVLRQAMRHNVGIVWSELSGRYVDLRNADYWSPEAFREAAPTVKQGSGGPLENQVGPRRVFEAVIRAAQGAYEALLDMGVCKEQARTVLPTALYSEVYMTGSLQAFTYFIRLRQDSHAQAEIQEYAQAMRKLLDPLFPVSIATLLP